MNNSSRFDLRKYTLSKAKEVVDSSDLDEQLTVMIAIRDNLNSIESDQRSSYQQLLQKIPEIPGEEY